MVLQRNLFPYVCLQRETCQWIARFGSFSLLFLLQNQEYHIVCRGPSNIHPNGWILYCVIQAAIDMPCYKEALSCTHSSILAYLLPPESRNTESIHWDV